MRSLFLFVIIFVKSISPVFCGEEILDPLQGKKHPWVVQTGTLYDYRLITPIHKTTSENSETTSYFCQIKYHDPEKVNLHFFGLVNELVSDKTGKKYYFMDAFVDIEINKNGVITQTQLIGTRKDTDKIRKLENYLDKLRSQIIVPAVTETSIRDLETLQRCIKTPKPRSVWDFLGLA